jgi:acyl carrier protein
MKQKLELKIREIIHEELDIPLKKISPNSLFVEDLGADSFDTANILTAIYAETKIEISNEEAQTFKKVNDLIRHIDKKRNR